MGNSNFDIGIGGFELGCGLIMAKPQPDASEFGLGEERRSELVVSGGHASEIFELVEEALNQAALFVVTCREADRVSLPNRVAIRTTPLLGT